MLLNSNWFLKIHFFGFFFSFIFGFCFSPRGLGFLGIQSFNGLIVVTRVASASAQDCPSPAYGWVAGTPLPTKRLFLPGPLFLRSGFQSHLSGLQEQSGVVGGGSESLLLCSPDCICSTLTGILFSS